MRPAPGVIRTRNGWGRSAAVLRYRWGPFRVTEFRTTTSQLLLQADWLVERQVALVGMEATGVYWKPVVRHEARIGDKRVLGLVKAFLKSGILGEDGELRASDTGTPQGAILSPLLSNVALSVLDEHFVAAS